MTTEEVARALIRGEVAIVPTDTVYGLAARPDRAAAVQRLFDLKGRPADKAIPVLGSGVRDLEQVAVFDERAQLISERFWPGPLTLVLERAPAFEPDLGGKRTDTIAVRVPDRAATLELLGLTGPLAVTSANRSGEPPCSDAVEASSAWPQLCVLDDGPAGGTASTILSLVGETRVLRSGELDGRDVLAVLDE